MNTPPFFAARSGVATSMRAFVDAGFDHTSQGYQGRKWVMGYLLGRTEAKEVVNVQTSNGETPLHWEQNPKIVELLLRYGANIEVRNNRGNTPAHQIAISSKILCMGALIDAGFDFNTRGRFGRTVLHSAVWDHNPVMLEYLLLHGRGSGIIDALDSDGRTPLAVAIQHFLFWGSSLTLAVVNLLVHYGSDLELQIREESDLRI